MTSLEVTVTVSRVLGDITLKAWGPVEFRAAKVLRAYEQKVCANPWSRQSLGILTREMGICPL